MRTEVPRHGEKVEAPSASVLGHGTVEFPISLPSLAVGPPHPNSHGRYLAASSAVIMKQSRSVKQLSSAVPRHNQCSHVAPCWRQFSHSAPRAVVVSVPEHQDTPESMIPRWKRTPPALQYPFRVNSPSRQKPLRINNNPDVLHAVLDRILGKDGWNTLNEETRWLAVTHKSFDQGRRGFNDRLSYLGHFPTHSPPHSC